MKKKPEPNDDPVGHILKPLCKIVESANKNDLLGVRMNAEHIARILDVFGYHREAKRVETSAGL